MAVDNKIFFPTKLGLLKKKGLVDNKPTYFQVYVQLPKIHIILCLVFRKH